MDSRIQKNPKSSSGSMMFTFLFALDLVDFLGRIISGHELDFPN